jgi:hypothetical protein
VVESFMNIDLKRIRREAVMASSRKILAFILKE